MRNLIAVPIIFLAVQIQMAIVSRVPLVSGTADLPLVMLAACALQEGVESSWQWAIATGLLVGFVSSTSFVVPFLSYALIVLLASYLQRRVWQSPLLAMLLLCFVGTIVSHILTLVALRASGVSLNIADSLGLITLPSMLLNLLLAVPIYAIMRDLARWTYPQPVLE